MAKQDQAKDPGENSQEKNPAIDDATEQLQKMARESEYGPGTANSKGERSENFVARLQELLDSAKKVLADRGLDAPEPPVYSDEAAKKVYDEVLDFLGKHTEDEFEGQDRATFKEFKEVVFPDLDVDLHYGGIV